MKKFLLPVLAITLLLAGCSPQYPMEANLKLQITGQSPGIYSGSSATLTGHDARKDNAVLVYQLKDKPEVRIPNGKAPHILITEQLAAGLQEQGLVFLSPSPVHIQLNLNKLVAQVTRPELLYNATAKSNLSLTIQNGKLSLTKTYDRQGTQDSATRPKVEELEKMLDDQLIDIVKQILQDDEVRAAIKRT